MLNKILLKLKAADDKPLAALIKAIYFNVIRLNTFVLFGLDLKKKMDFSPLALLGENAKVINHHELRKYLPLDKNLPREFYMHEIDGVEYCVVILNNGKITSISWLYFKKDPNRWYELDNDEAILNYVYTLPEYRGKGLFPLALLKCAQWLQERDFKQVIIPVHSETRFMLKSMNKVPGIKKLACVRQWFLMRPKYKRPS